jgi:hypothetical protein
MGNGSVNMFPLLGSRFLIMQHLENNNRKAVFSTWPMPGSYLEDNWGDPVRPVWSTV